jgi:hypothetical protein
LFARHGQLPLNEPHLYIPSTINCQDVFSRRNELTPFHADFSFDEVRYRENLDWLCGYKIADLFAAGGTGGPQNIIPSGTYR